MLDTRTEMTIATVREQAQQLFGQDLLCLALFGSAAGTDFVPGRSDINLAIVLRQLRFAHLEALQTKLPQWRGDGLATPILLDLDFLKRAVDVFPMEFQDIKARHRVLFGTDLFSDITIDSAQLRFQLEQEARGKLLRLRLAFVEGDRSDAQLEGLMLRSLKSFLSVGRSLVRWRQPGATFTDLELLERLSQVFQLQLPVIARMVAVRLGRENWWATRLDIFRDYLAEVVRLVELVDHLDSSS